MSQSNMFGWLTPEARQSLRSDTNTFSVTQARLTLQMRPVSIAALRIQGNFAALDSTIKLPV